MTTTRPLRSRRVVAAALALPLSLAMTGTALASGGSTVQLRGSETSPADAGSGRAAADAPAAATARTAADQPGTRNAADRPAAAPAAGAGAEARKPGAAAGAASGRSAAESAAQEAKPAAPKKADQAAPADKPAPAAKPAEKPASAEQTAEKPAPAAKPADKPAPAAKPADKPAPARGASSGPAAKSSPTTEPQPLSKADKNGTGANPGSATCGHSYCSTRDGKASGNGAGDRTATGKPCAGCVGKADNKNPKGQGPDGNDRNAGYECDRNSGIGRTNPAHTGCTPGGTPLEKPTKPETPKTPKKPGDVGGPFPEVELCPDGSVLPQDGPAGCPKAPPVCPKESLFGPVMAGCETEVPPTQGNSPIAGGTEQPAEGAPIGGVTPGQPATRPVPVGPPTTVPSRSVPIAIVPNTAVVPTALAGGTRLPGTAAVPSALPFTGTDAALLAALGLVLLLGGGGILVAARQERTARAA